MPPKKSVEKYVPAPTKEVLVLVINVGKTMSLKGNTYLTNIKHAASLFAKSKIRYFPKCEMSIILLGVKEESQNCNYDSVRIDHPLQIVSMRTMKQIDSIQWGGAEVDISDGIRAAIDHIQGHCGKLKYRRRICLITDAGSKMSSFGDYSSVFEDTDRYWEFDLVQVDWPETVDPNSTAGKLDALVEKLQEPCAPVVINLETMIGTLASLKSKKVAQRTAWRGTLDFGDTMKLGVWMYKKSDKSTIPTAKKTTSTGGEVQTVRSYYAVDDPDTEIDLEKRQSSYRYGKNFVPVSEFDNKKFETEKCMSLTGFTERDRIPRHHFLSCCYKVVGEPFNEHAGQGIASLVRACAEMNKVAIVRYVRINNATPVLAVLLPVVKAEESYFHMVHLPYARDLRQYPFKSFDNLKISNEQLEAAEILINEMNLMEADVDEDGNKTEALKPKETFNPAVQIFHDFCHERVLHPESTVLPPIDPVVEKYCLPENSSESFYPKLMEKAKDALANFKRVFPLEKVESEKSKPAQKRFWFAVDDKDVALESYKKKKTEGIDEMDLVMEKVDADIMSTKVKEVGQIDPTKDFLEMCANRKDDLYKVACESLQNVLLELINDSIEDQLYNKVYRALETYRAQAIKENTPDVFNTYLRKLKTQYSEGSRADFWELIKQNKMSLITIVEASRSLISTDEAARFLEERIQKIPETAPLGVERDDLLDELE